MTARRKSTKPLKTRSRGGCHHCKKLKIKCSQDKPACKSCERLNIACDYTLKLSWGGRRKRTDEENEAESPGPSPGQLGFLHRADELGRVFKPVPKQQPVSTFILEMGQTTPRPTSDYSPTFASVSSDNGTDIGMGSGLEIVASSVSSSTLALPQDMPLDSPDGDLTAFLMNYSVDNLPTESDLIGYQNPDLDFGNFESFYSSIPGPVETLPDILVKVPLYRDLLHHFVTVTADMLVPVPPHIYPDNPFKTILPRMAFQTPHLLSLIISYAATHKANYYAQDDSYQRELRLVARKQLEHTFDGLSKSLMDVREANSDSTLATAIMLCSFEILSGGGADDRWKTHLHGAREIIMARGMANRFNGGVLSLTYEKGTGGENEAGEKMPSREATPPSSGIVPPGVATQNEISHFLLRTFAYIDVIGALSSPSASSMLVNDDKVAALWQVHNFKFDRSAVPAGMEVSDIDFLLGVDLSMIPVFSQVASLVRRRIRLDGSNGRMQDPRHQLEEQAISSEALALSETLLSCSTQISNAPSFGDLELEYFVQLSVMNAVFCYAALIHLYRRALKFESQSDTVQEIVREITRLLETKIPPGASIIACMSFPIFTTACEVYDEPTRALYRARLDGMRKLGAGHITKMADVVEKCWAEGKPWTQVLNEMGWVIVLA